MADSLLGHITAHARTQPSKDALIFVRGRREDRTEQRLTYGELDRTARRIGRWLSERCAPGDRVVLLLPSGLDFVTALFGCHHAGLVAVPAPPPGIADRKGARTAGIIEDSGARLVFTDTAHLAAVQELLDESKAGLLPCHAVDGIDLAPYETADDAPDPELSDNTVAVLQYTSGSTSDPKGVMLTHGALMNNLRNIEGWLGISRTTRVCSWLPLYHDMGLIGMLFELLYLGGEVVLFASTDFIRRPHTWFEVVQEYQCQVITAPNFAYELMTRQLSDTQVAAADLSSVRWALNGAEPLDAATMERFQLRFAPAGFRAEALIPCYGLAEATLFVAGTPVGRGPLATPVDPAALEQHRFESVAPGAGAHRLVSSGHALGLDVRIVDPDTLAEQAAGAIGEIWVRGGSVTPGYWNRPEENARSFDASTASGAGGFLRTGDLGVLHDGELYVTGRSKDVLVVRGRNLYAHDLERHVGALHSGFQGLKGSVCALPFDEEQIVVMHEYRPSPGVKADLPALVRAVRAELTERFGVRVPNVVLLRPGQVQRTTSGKVRRSLMLDLFVAGELKTVHEDLAPEVVRRRAAVSASAAGNTTA
ncbi:fatty acyl-AMP ligase (plasmid) [Streptomyces sp. NBC_00440]|uniref:fatty acyl-AMP ligase n=1 Tax=unclassified Streptomyces TaxID=2593676 RepID=UPI002E1D7D3F|nr:fatty acyl-AMP ligase [Streptomyces sp. NBC_00963]